MNFFSLSKILLKDHSTKEVKNNNGTSVLIKPEDKLIPGIKIHIDAAINPINFLCLLLLKLQAVKAIKNADKECNIGDPILIQNSESPHKDVKPFINHDKNGGFE